MKIILLIFIVLVTSMSQTAMAEKQPDISPLLQKYQCKQYGKFELGKKDTIWYVISKNNKTKAIMFLCEKIHKPELSDPNLLLVAADKGHPWSKCPDFVHEVTGSIQNLILKGFEVNMGDITELGFKYICLNSKWKINAYH